MKKTQSLFSLALALALILSLAGCGGSASDSDAAEATRPEYAESEEDTAGITSEEIAAVGVQAQQSEQDKIIYSAEARLETRDYPAALESVYALVDELGGYIESSSIGGTGYGSHGGRYAEFVIRVPGEKFSELTERLPDMGNLAYCRSYTENVTTQYIDVQARLESYRIQEERLLAMLEQAGTLEDMLTIEDHLADVRYNIDTYTSQLNYLDSQVDYSTVTLSVEEVVEYSPDSSINRSFFSRMGDALGGGMTALLEAVQSIVLLLLYFWYVAAAAVVIAVVLIRRRRRRKAKKTDETEK